MFGALILLGLSAALAQEATVDPAAPTEGEGATEAAPAAEAAEAPATPTSTNEEMVVWGERVGRTRSELDGQLRAYGYKVKRKRGDVTVYGRSGTQRWKPKVLVSDSGVVWFRNPLVVVYPPIARAEPVSPQFSPAGQAMVAGSVEDRGVLRLMFPVQVPSKRIQKQEQARVLSAAGVQIQAFQGAIIGQGEAALLQTFPEKLDRLWEQGVDPRGGPALPDATARKAALIELYRTRADTSAGRAVQAMIQDYVVEVVQSSPTPLTEAERAAASAAGLTIP